MPDKPILQQFDQVEVLTTRRVSYLSAKPGSAPSPHGVWNVVGIIDGEILLAKEGALIRIPLNDVRKVRSYDVESIMSQLDGVSGYGKDKAKDKDKKDYSQNISGPIGRGDS